MLRLPGFSYESPATLDEAVALLAEHPGRARLLAGGTDLLPNLKHGIEEADVVISLGRLEELREVHSIDRRHICGQRRRIGTDVLQHRGHAQLFEQLAYLGADPLQVNRVRV